MIFYLILIFGFIFDLVTKKVASIYLGEKINILGNIFYLEYFENPGIAFSIPIPSMILKILTLILIIGIFYYYKQEKKSKLGDISFGFILAGALGNGYERVFNGVVIDFIGVQYFSVFNFADCFITLGAFIYIYTLFSIKK